MVYDSKIGGYRAAHDVELSKLRHKVKEEVNMELKNWSFTKLGFGYQAPELLSWKAQGEVYGNDKFPEGHEVTTSKVRSVNWEHMIVTTTSGNTYKLTGEPDPKWAAWCFKHGYTLDDFKKCLPI